MKLNKAIMVSLDKLLNATANILDDTTRATRHNWIFIKHGLQASLYVTFFWIRFLIYIACLPYLLIYAFYHQLKKGGAND